MCVAMAAIIQLYARKRLLDKKKQATDTPLKSVLRHRDLISSRIFGGCVELFRLISKSYTHPTKLAVISFSFLRAALNH
jgi:hypothetical protein